MHGRPAEVNSPGGSRVGAADLPAAAIAARRTNAPATLQRRWTSFARQKRNAELQQQLAKARSTAASWPSGPAGPARLGGGETADPRRLEADVDGDDKAQRSERPKIEDVVRTTDEIIAAKDREIQELNERLEEGSHNAAAKTPDTVSVDRAMSQAMPACGKSGRSSNSCRTSGRRKFGRRKWSWPWNGRRSPGNAPNWKGTIPAPGMRRRAAGGDRCRPAAEVGRRRWLARLGLTDADREPSGTVGYGLGT